ARAEPRAEAPAGAPDPDVDARLSRLEQTVERQQEDLRLLTEGVRIVRDYLDKK
nr:hypothetical protein [Gammaproteobacteria bacterium]